MGSRVTADLDIDQFRTGDEPPTKKVVSYGPRGQKCHCLSPSCVAREESWSGGALYWVKSVFDGPMAGTFHNPESPAPEQKPGGTPTHEWRRVSEQAFRLYLQFLSTRIQTYLGEAQRN